MQSSNPSPPWEPATKRKHRLRAFRPKVKQHWAGESDGKDPALRKWVLVFVFLLTVALSPVAVFWYRSRASAQASAAKVEGPKGQKSVSSSDTYFPDAEGSGPAVYIMENVVPVVLDERYRSRKQISTGRFLRDFERNLERLHGVDTTRWRVVRRGRTWVELEGPWIADGESEPKTAVIRFVLADNQPWRLENIRILPEVWEDE